MIGSRTGDIILYFNGFYYEYKLLQGIPNWASCS